MLAKYGRRRTLWSFDEFCCSAVSDALVIERLERMAATMGMTLSKYSSGPKKRDLINQGVREDACNYCFRHPPGKQANDYLNLLRALAIDKKQYAPNTIATFVCLPRHIRMAWLAGIIDSDAKARHYFQISQTAPEHVAIVDTTRRLLWSIGALCLTNVRPAKSESEGILMNKEKTRKLLIFEVSASGSKALAEIESCVARKKIATEALGKVETRPGDARRAGEKAAAKALMYEQHQAEVKAGMEERLARAGGCGGGGDFMEDEGEQAPAIGGGGGGGVKEEEDEADEETAPAPAAAGNGGVKAEDVGARRGCVRRRPLPRPRRRQPASLLQRRSSPRLVVALRLRRLPPRGSAAPRS